MKNEITMDNVQKLQEEEYNFPYHHLVSINPFSEVQNLWWGYRYGSYIEKILLMLKGMDFDSIVDIGCGDGKLIFELSKWFPLKHIIGTDYSEKSLRYAKAFSPEIEFRKESAEKFDVFTLVEVLEHIPPQEMESFVKSLSESLNDKGIGIVTTPHINMPMNKKHYQHFTKESITATFEKYFLIERFEYISANNSTTKLVQRILANRFFILNYKPLVNYLYNLYKSHSLNANAKNATQVFVVLKKK